MASVQRLVLDVLKPHQPNALEFASVIATALGDGYRVEVRVTEVDDKTETLLVAIEGNELDFDLVNSTITESGASLHSIDEVSVVG